VPSTSATGRPSAALQNTAVVRSASDSRSRSRRAGSCACAQRLGAAEDTDRGPNAGRSAASVHGAQVADRTSRLITGEKREPSNVEVT
jgi:hypothetical protein